MKMNFNSELRAVRSQFVWTAILIAFGAHGQNLFVSTADGNIYQYTPSGTQSTFISSLYQPSGLAFNNAGDLFVGVGGSDILRFPAQGSPNLLANGLSQPSGMVVNGAGDLFEADTATGNIYEFTPGGARSTFASGVGLPVGLAFYMGNLFTSDNFGNIYKIEADGTRTTFASGLSFPQGLAINNAGDVFVAANGDGSIYEFTQDGTRSTFASGLYAIGGLAINTAGDLFAADYNNGNIYEFAPDGTSSTFAAGLNAPNFLAFQPVPEPSTLGFLSVGIFGMLFFSGRRALTRLNVSSKQH